MGAGVLAETLCHRSSKTLPIIVAKHAHFALVVNIAKKQVADFVGHAADSSGEWRERKSPAQKDKARVLD
jgi:hypothetical protein